MTEQKVIEFLRSYRKYAPEIVALDMSIKEIRANAAMHAHSLDGMPRGGEPQDLSDFGAKIDKEARRLEEKKRAARVQRGMIEKTIARLEDPEERAALRHHYINGLAWWQAALEMHCSERRVYNLRKSAIRKLTKIL